jgi:tRNA (guanine26-N2/guanine27-N2)-dimethyltransferase
LQVHPDSIPESRLKGLTRWQANPQKNWGPKPRAKRQPQGQNDGNNKKKKKKTNQEVKLMVDYSENIVNNLMENYGLK